jgi:predicted dithiol-disulfide oxidoreductase (DUF899 family)
MADPQIVSREEWLQARRQLLEQEKELTRHRDEVNADRRRLPMVEVEKEYVFDGPNGKATLLDLFEARRQLIVHHFMFDPEWDAGCPSCSFAIDSLPHLSHLHARGTTVALVSRAPLEKLEAYRRRMGWSVPWYSSHGSDFNYDFHVTQDPRVAPLDYNYKPREELERVFPEGTDWSMEVPGQSAFLRRGDRVFHTYSTYARGADLIMGAYNWLDLTALGRQ